MTLVPPMGVKNRNTVQIIFARNQTVVDAIGSFDIEVSFLCFLETHTHALTYNLFLSYCSAAALPSRETKSSLSLVPFVRSHWVTLSKESTSSILVSLANSFVRLLSPSLRLS